MQFDLNKVDPDERYKLLVQSVIPRPIAWVLSANEDGKTFNLAPFSYFSLICDDPGIVTLSLALNARAERKDTLKNIERTRKCVIHIAPSRMASEMTATAFPFNFGESEVTALGLKLEWDNGPKEMPRVEGPKLALYCSLMQSLEVGNDQHTLLLAEVNKLYCAEDCLSKSDQGSWRIDPKKVDPLLRMGGSLYGTLGQVIDSPRPTSKPSK